MKKFYLLEEGVTRIILMVIFLITELKYIAPFNRIVHPEESYLYGNPKTQDYFPGKYLWIMVIVVPLVCVLTNYVYLRRKEDWRINDAKSALLCLTLLFPLTGALINILKLTVGRPRPDFFFRCWPDRGHPDDVNVFNILKDGTQDLGCNGNVHAIIEGRKSFPSGHSAFSFATFGFMLFYLSGKLSLFTPSHKMNERTFLLCVGCILSKFSIACW